MRFKLSTLQLLALAVLITLLTALTVLALDKAPPPTPHSEQHTSQTDFWDSIRMRPVKVLTFDGKTLQYEFQDGRRVELGSFETDDRTQALEGIKDGQYYIVVYCETHKILYQVIPLKPA